MIFIDRIHAKSVYRQWILDGNKRILQKERYSNKMATWHQEIYVGTDRGNSFKLLHWKNVSSFDSKNHSRSPRKDCAGQANLAGLTALWPLHTCVLLPLTSAQSTAAKEGFVWHTGSYMGRGSSLMAEQKHIPWDLDRDSNAALPAYKPAVLCKWLLLSQITQHSCTVTTWHRLVVTWSAAFLYIFSRNLLIVPFLVFLTCWKHSSFGPRKNTMLNIYVQKSNFRRMSSK